MITLVIVFIFWWKKNLRMCIFFSSGTVSCSFGPMVDFTTGKYGSDQGSSSSVRKRPDESPSCLWSTLLRNGLQQRLLQQRQLCPRPLWSWTDTSYLWYRDGPGNWNFCIRETKSEYWRRELISSFLSRISYNIFVMDPLAWFSTCFLWWRQTWQI